MSDDTTARPASSPDGSSPDASAAVDALARADGVEDRTRRAAGWYARYMAVFGAGFGVMTLVLGLGPDEAGPAVAWTLALLVVWGAFVAGMVVWASRRPVHGALHGRSYVPGWVGTSVLYALALGVGLSVATPAWVWPVAAVLVAAPLVLSARQLQRSVA